MKKHTGEIEQNESATKYLKDHLNGYGKIPEKAWRAEQDAPTAERYGLCDGYYKLKDDVKNLETLRHGAENIISEELPERTRTRIKDLGL